MAFGSFDIQDQPFNSMRRPRGIFSQPPVTNTPGAPQSNFTPQQNTGEERSNGRGGMQLITGANPPTPTTPAQQDQTRQNFLSNVFNVGLGPQQGIQSPLMAGVGMGRRMF